MSIVTLKKKAAAKYNNSSVNSSTGFSLNGGYRNQGYVGQTSLSRSLPRTLMSGIAYKGYGGCCGKFPINPPVSSAVLSTEDHNVIKKSSLTNAGMIASHYRWIRRPDPFISVKPTTINQNSQQPYIDYIHKKYLIDPAGPCAITTKHANATCNNVSKPSTLNACPQNFNPEAKYMKSSDYIEALTQLSTENDISDFQIKKITNNTPFACAKIK